MTFRERADGVRPRPTEPYTDEVNQDCLDSIALAIEDAVKEKSEQICTYIEEQNSMVNTLWGEKTETGRHDAFVRDITKAIREGKPHG